MMLMNSERCPVCGDNLSTCTWISRHTRYGNKSKYVGSFDELVEPASLTVDELEKYAGKDGELYGWHFTNVKGIKAKDFFMKFFTADCEHIAVENPIPSKVFQLPTYNQTIQPYEYGHPFTKKTCLWLKNLPLLKPTNIVLPERTFCPSGSYSGKHNEKYRGVFTKDRARMRSKTFEGIAKAMAEQWSEYLTNEVDNDKERAL